MRVAYGLAWVAIEITACASFGSSADPAESGSPGTDSSADAASPADAAPPNHTGLVGSCVLHIRLLSRSIGHQVVIAHRPRSLNIRQAELDARPGRRLWQDGHVPAGDAEGALAFLRG
jgi:hypothetical protein